MAKPNKKARPKQSIFFAHNVKPNYLNTAKVEKERWLNVLLNVLAKTLPMKQVSALTANVNSPAKQ